MKRVILFILVSCQLILSASANDGSSLWLPRERNAVASSVVMGPKCMALEELKSFYKGSTPVCLRVDKKALAGDAFRIDVNPERIELAAGNTSGLLYAVYDLLRMQQLGEVRSKEEHPAFDLRLLNHWDNLDGSVERGYAGRSIWKWEEMQMEGKVVTMSPSLRQHIVDYARANASLGINGIVINNVNASPKMLSEEILRKVQAISTNLFS